MTWTGQSFSVGQVLTAAQMNNLQADITALANGDAGAPSITQAALGVGCVHQAELDTSQNSTSIAEGASTTLVSTGGEYSFYPTVKYTGSAAITAQFWSGTTTPTTSYTARVQVAAGTVAYHVVTLEIAFRYINSSPPYDMGDGLCHHFYYAMIDKTTGDLIAISSAPDPVWVHNGPTSCRPDGKDKNGLYQLITTLPQNWDTMTPQAKLAFMKAHLPPQKRYIDQALKHADWDVFPHPFIDDEGYQVGDRAVVLLDPVSDIVADLHLLENAGENIGQLIANNFLRIDNVPLNRYGPAGLEIVSCAWV